MSSINDSPTKGGRKRVKPEPSSDDEYDSKTYVLNTPPPKKRGRPAQSTGSASKSRTTAACPSPFVPDPSITKATDGKVICAVLEKMIMTAGPELRTEIAAMFGVEARLLHMAWSTHIRKRSIIALRKEFVGESST